MLGGLEEDRVLHVRFKGNGSADDSRDWILLHFSHQLSSSVQGDTFELERKQDDDGPQVMKKANRIGINLEKKYKFTETQLFTGGGESFFIKLETEDSCLSYGRLSGHKFHAAGRLE